MKTITIPESGIYFDEYKGSRTKRRSVKTNLIFVKIPQDNQEKITKRISESIPNTILGILNHCKLLLRPEGKTTIVNYLVEVSKANKDAKTEEDYTKHFASLTLQSFIKVRKKNQYLIKSTELKRIGMKEELIAFKEAIEREFLNDVNIEEYTEEYNSNYKASKSMINFLNKYFKEKFSLYLNLFNFPDIKVLFQMKDDSENDSSIMEALHLTKTLEQVLTQFPDSK